MLQDAELEVSQEPSKLRIPVDLQLLVHNNDC